METIEHVRKLYAALVSMCDHSLGRVLSFMDEQDMWNDTMLIVTTDHGFHLGEHGWWNFVNPPMYDVTAHKPLFIWDPRCRRRGERCPELVQFIDVPATLLEAFELKRPPDMQGRPLADTIARDTAVREAALMGVFGREINCTDGRYVYMRAPATAENRPLHNYTVMPTHMREPFSPAELRTAELSGPFSFSKGCPLMRVAAEPFFGEPGSRENMLFDLQQDPGQQAPINDPVVEQRMADLMVTLMKQNDAPPEQFERMGLPNTP